MHFPCPQVERSEGCWVVLQNDFPSFDVFEALLLVVVWKHLASLVFWEAVLFVEACDVVGTHILRVYQPECLGVVVAWKNVV